ncbi:MAG: hypothetical protein JWO82_840 [Akkermansiaceae bacterium]|nr:hypothetical protein [Akkermansiaceae bacterium]
MKSIFVSLAVCALAVSQQAGAAAIFTETFNTSGDTAGWFQVSDSPGTTLEQEPVSGVLNFSGTSASIFYVAADGSSSGGAFSGDYTAAGITGIRFSLQLDAGSTMSQLVFELTNLTADETWQYTLTLGAAGIANDYFVPIPGDGSGWTQTTGSESFGSLLSQVEEAGLALNGSTNGPVSGHLDNVATVPEASGALLALAGLAMAGLRRRR